MLSRLAYNLFILIAIATAPWQSYALFIIAGFFLFDNYYEGIIWGVVIDAVYSGGTYKDLSLGLLWNYYFFTVLTVICFPVSFWIKKYVTWYD